MRKMVSRVTQRCDVRPLDDGTHVSKFKAAIPPRRTLGGSTRVLRRHEAEKRHGLPGMVEASDVADFDDETDGRDK